MVIMDAGTTTHPTNPTEDDLSCSAVGLAPDRSVHCAGRAARNCHSPTHPPNQPGGVLRPPPSSAPAGRAGRPGNCRVQLQGQASLRQTYVVYANNTANSNEFDHIMHVIMPIITYLHIMQNTKQIRMIMVIL